MLASFYNKPKDLFCTWIPGTFLDAVSDIMEALLTDSIPGTLDGSQREFRAWG